VKDEKSKGCRGGRAVEKKEETKELSESLVSSSEVFHR